MGRLTFTRTVEHTHMFGATLHIDSIGFVWNVILGAQENGAKIYLLNA